jgi:competence protein ComEC
MRKTILCALFFLAVSPMRAAKTLEIYFIDVEGGQSTLFVAPSGDAMLVDTGWPDFNGRDADRIVAAAKLAGVKQIDYLVITHYHADHVGGVPQLYERIPIRNFVDHGESVETGKNADELFKAYDEIRDKGNHILAKPGNKIPIRGIEVTILTAAGNTISKPLPGAGAPNALCATATLKEADPSENARSIGMLIRFGKFRMIDLGDLTWNKEHDLVCPDNRVGTVDVYLSTHHGLDQSGSPVIVHALHPKVAIMNNGATKGGAAEAWQTIHTSPGLEDIWQLHYAVAGGDANNAAGPFIANRDEQEGNWIRISAESSGRFKVTNSRNQNTKTYSP